MSVPRDTVAAVATAPGKGALAVIRISGPGAFSICGVVLNPRERFRDAPPRHVGVYRLYDPRGNRFVDQVCAVKYAAPRSYTGEDMVEITCHGGEVVPSLVMQCLAKTGARQAMPGEFTRRAISAGKMDALTAEATLALIDSTTEDEHARAALFYRGAGAHAISGILQRIMTLSASVEASIEAAGEGVADAGTVRSELASICRVIWEELRLWERGQSRSGRLVIAGVANAGKSTLFNLLVGSERALVDSRAGTTRDYVSERIVLGGALTEVVDTAGFGCIEEGIAQTGIARAWEQIDTAGTVVWVCPLDRGVLTGEEVGLVERSGSRRLLVVLSKADKEDGCAIREAVTRLGVEFVAGNLTNEVDRERVMNWVSERSAHAAGSGSGEMLVMNARHGALLREVVLEVELVLEDGNSGIDLLADAIRRMETGLTGLDPSRGGEELLARILSRFCVGK